MISDPVSTVTIVVRTNLNALTASTPIPSLSGQESESSAGHDMHATFEIGFDYPGPGEKNPLHENIAIAAFLNSTIVFPKAATYSNLNHKQWEYFRGIIWNDDPECFLFEKSTNDDRSVGISANCHQKFKLGDAKRMTQKSHFGDLHFLHAMGAADGEMPYTTRELIPLRVLGICMHMIQDSYAMGRVKRRLLNHWGFERRDEDEHLVFRPGNWAQWGPIVSFHTYGTQDEDRHPFYDGLEGASVPNPRDIGSFNRLLGARDAINACVLLINPFARKQLWTELRREMETWVFAIGPNEKPCNSAVDKSIPDLNYAYAEETEYTPEATYHTGLDEMTMLLDPEADTLLCAAIQQRREIMWLRRLALTLLILVVLLLIMWFKGCTSARHTHV
ncbi:hypothetical protein E8E11_001466 [Didymella keratinophila]|nr:hypothetical protein E8E11_001466 [Didymella keratinophila]